MNNTGPDRVPLILDPSAPNERAEYVRYLDLDLLGKIVARNLLINRLGYLPGAVSIPLGRYGDAKPKYAVPGKVAHDLTDGHIETDQGSLSFEVKCARINIENRSLGHTQETRAFQGLLKSPKKVAKSYDILIAIGLRRLGLEEHRYWSHLEATRKDLQSRNIPFAIDAWPHEPSFLSLCSFFILPRACLSHNFFRINLSSLKTSKYGSHQAWGHDGQRCIEVWQKH